MRLTYANVMSTLAVFIALGGSSYAAIKITGKNVKDGSLTGRDIKRKSVPLNRLSGKLPAGPRGATGAPGAQGLRGEQGIPGPVDPSQFLASSGLHETPQPLTAWRIDPSTSNLDGARETTWFTATSNTASGSGQVVGDATIPTLLAGRRVRLRGADVCFDLTAPLKITQFTLQVSRVDPATGGALTVPSFGDDTNRTADGCAHVSLSTPLELGRHDLIRLYVSTNWTGSGGSVRLRPLAIEWDTVA